jgi:hypothetical protein
MVSLVGYRSILPLYEKEKHTQPVGNGVVKKKRRRAEIFVNLAMGSCRLTRPSSPICLRWSLTLILTSRARTMMDGFEPEARTNVAAVTRSSNATAVPAASEAVTRKLRPDGSLDLTIIGSPAPGTAQ